MIDLHSHTYYSDGSSSPEELLQLAIDAGLDAFSVTDHDTFAGFEHVASLPRPASVELIRGIEVTCKLGKRTAHLLGYFLNGEPASEFHEWLNDRHVQRRDRNRRLAKRMQDLGLDVELEEVESLGRSMTGRPHFARLLVSKGYASSVEDAFQRYLGEEAVAYVQHDAPPLEEGIRRIQEAGGISSLAHPIRLGGAFDEAFLACLTRSGIRALEVFHFDHSMADRTKYLALARKYGLAVTGGSDFHGTVKPRVPLGGAHVENWVLDELRASR